jgi:acyl-CoA synthetase (AMP-forming)/AMP-acid ligase II
MTQPNSTILSLAEQQMLRADATLGSGNFLDRCHALNPARAVEFLFLDIPITLPDGATYRAFSLETLIEARRTLARWYLTHDVTPGDVVAVCVTDGIAPFLHYLALTSLGAAGAFVNPAMPPDTAAAYIEKNGFARIVSDARVLQRTGLAGRLPTGCELIDCSFAGASQVATLPSWWPHKPEDSTLVMLSHTSGTTGIPKAVKFEHRQFFMGKRARIGQFVESDDERLLSALPQSHSAAISHLETAVLLGVPTYVLGTPVGAAVRMALLAFKPTTVAAFPQTYASLVQSGVAPGEFSTVRRWFSMGDAAHESHTRRILAGAPNSRFIDAFGSSELGMALFRKISTAAEIAPRRSVGRPVDVAIAKVLDAATGDEVSAGRVGLLAVRAPTLTPGYWREPEITAKAWRGGYFLTGDVGFCKDGDFYLIDRAVDVIASPVGPLYTLLLEEEVQQVAGVCDVSVVGVDAADGSCVFALVLPDRLDAAHTQSLGQDVWTALHEAVKANGAALAPDAVTVAIAGDSSSFPVGATGKVLKRKLRERFATMSAALADGDKPPAGIVYLTNGLATVRRSALDGSNRNAKVSYRGSMSAHVY